jgi:uncharacterized protein YcbK (DUF882 family)
MKTTATREAAARRQPRTPAQRAAHKPAHKTAQADWAWPGVTRAQLRDHIIEMIG